MMTYMGEGESFAPQPQELPQVPTNNSESSPTESIPQNPTGRDYLAELAGSAGQQPDTHITTPMADEFHGKMEDHHNYLNKQTKPNTTTPSTPEEIAARIQAKRAADETERAAVQQAIRKSQEEKRKAEKSLSGRLYNLIPKGVRDFFGLD